MQETPTFTLVTKLGLIIITAIAVLISILFGSFFAWNRLYGNYLNMYNTQSATVSIGYSFCEGNMRITNLRDAVEQV